MKLSVLIPGIRPELWLKVCDSLAKSCTENEWEVVFVGPTFPDNLSGHPNVKYIHSYASPIVCRQIALIECTGDWICYAADDVEFIEGALDRSFQIISQNNQDYKTVVVGKYLEGISDVVLDNLLMRDDPYWSLYFHVGLREILRPQMREFFLINTGVLSKKLMLELGGWDCRFEACAMACCDLSIRVQTYGAHCILQHLPIFKSTHLPGHAGDHAPIHDGQTQHDEPLFFEIWRNPAATNRTVIAIDNWMDFAGRWERRFGAAV